MKAHVARAGAIMLARAFSIWLSISALNGCHTATEPSPQSIAMCQLRDNEAQLSGQLVRLKVMWASEGHHGAVLIAPDCRNFALIPMPPQPESESYRSFTRAMQESKSTRANRFPIVWELDLTGVYLFEKGDYRNVFHIENVISYSRPGDSMLACGWACGN